MWVVGRTALVLRGASACLVCSGVVDAERLGLYSHAERGNDQGVCSAVRSAIKKGHHFWQPLRVQLTESESNQSQLNAPPV